MAFTAVTTTRNQGAAATTSTTPTAAFAGSGPSKDSFLVALVTTYGSSRTVNSITDTQGNVWKSLPTQAITSPAMVQQLWYCERNKAAGANTLTVTLSGAPTASVIQLQEYTTTAGKGAVLSHSDVSNAAVVDSRGGVYSTTASQTSLAVPVQASGTDRNGDLIVAGFGFSATATTTISISAVSGGGSQAVDCQFNGTATYAIQAALAHAVATSAAVPSVTFAFAAHRYNGGVIAAFTECTIDGPNLLTPPEDDFEWGIGDWGPLNADTLAQSSAQARTGTYSISATSPGSVQYGINGLAAPPYVGAAVTPGHRITVMAFGRAAATPRALLVHATFYTAGGASVAYQERLCGTTATTNWTGGWVLAHFLVPATSATVRLQILTSAAGVLNEVQYFDSIMIADGVSCTWQAAPVTISVPTATATGAVPAMRALPVIVGTTTTNLLPSVDDGSFEGGTGAWVVGGGGTDVISTDYAVDGTHSVKVTGGFVSLHTPTPDVSLPQPATAGKDYSFLVSVRPLTINASFQLSIYSYQGATFLESVTSESVTAPTGQFTKLFLAAHAPASTDNVYLLIQRSGASDGFYADCAGLFEGYQPTWYPVVSASVVTGFVATATGGDPDPTINVTVAPPLATATGAAPAPTALASVLGLVSSATGAAPAGTLPYRLAGFVGAATGAAPAGTTAIVYSVVGLVSTASGAAVAPSSLVTLSGLVSAAVGSSPSGWTPYSIAGAVSSATGAALAGTLPYRIAGAVASATGASPVPVADSRVAASTVNASGAAPAPSISLGAPVTVVGFVASASGDAPQGAVVGGQARTVIGLVSSADGTAPAPSCSILVLGFTGTATGAAPSGSLPYSLAGQAAGAAGAALAGTIPMAVATAPAAAIGAAPAGSIPLRVPAVTPAAATGAASGGVVEAKSTGVAAQGTGAAPAPLLERRVTLPVAQGSGAAPQGSLSALVPVPVAQGLGDAPEGSYRTNFEVSLLTAAAQGSAPAPGVPLYGAVAAAAGVAAVPSLGLTVVGATATGTGSAPAPRGIVVLSGLVGGATGDAPASKVVYVVDVLGEVAAANGAVPALVAGVELLPPTPGAAGVALTAAWVLDAFGTVAEGFGAAPVPRVSLPSGRVTATVVTADGSPADGLVTWTLLDDARHDRPFQVAHFHGSFELELLNGLWEVVILTDEGASRYELEVEESSVGIGAGVPF